MNANSPITILDLPSYQKPLLVYNGWVRNGYQLLDVNDEKSLEEFIKPSDVTLSAWHDIQDAIKSGIWVSDENKDYSDDILSFAFSYCNVVGADADMRKIIFDTKDIEIYIGYCAEIEIDDEMRQAILDASIKETAEFAYWYCRDVGFDADMRQAIVDDGMPEYAYKYCRDVSDDQDMRQIIIDMEEADWACWYCCSIRKNEAMRQVIINSGKEDIAYHYCFDVEDDAEVRQVMIDSDDKQWIEAYNKRKSATA